MLTHTHTHTHKNSMPLLHNLTNKLYVILRKVGGGDHTAPGDLYSHTMSEIQVKTAVWRRTDRLVELAFTPKKSLRVSLSGSQCWDLPWGINPYLDELTDSSFAPQEITAFQFLAQNAASKNVDWEKKERGVDANKMFLLITECIVWLLWVLSTYVCV